MIMKKILSAVLAALIIASVICVTAYGADTGEIVIDMRSDVAGCTFADADRMMNIVSGEIQLNPNSNTDKVQITDYAGNVYLEPMKPGRTYYVDWSFAAADGFTFPENPDVSVVCGEGCNLLWYDIAYGRNDRGVEYYSLAVHTGVTADGNIFQMLFGRIADFFLKLRAWSLY